MAALDPEPLVRWVFERKTRQRFARLAQFLAVHAPEIAAWQRQQSTQAVASNATQPVHRP